ncbi:MAG: YggU family protein [Nitrospirae bacterium]|nr:YggU family protein [Nitrospirota bacterium]
MVNPRRAIVQDSECGVVLSVHVQPRASRTECVGIHGDALKVRVAAPPIDGAANDELIRYIADRCTIPPTNVLIQAGTKGRHKRLCVKGVTAELVMARLLPGGQKRAVKI